MKYCKLGINEKIVNIIEVAITDCQDADNNFNNTIGVEFLENLTGWSLWTPVTENSIGDAEIGGTWNDTDNVFASIKPYPSWTFNNTSGKWEAPSENPEPNNLENPYVWNESTQTWSQK
jgi:hypothetical protein